LCSLLKEYKLTCCEDAADTDIIYTYYQDTLGRCSAIDHMFVDSSLCHNIISNCTVESGVNFSDHVPISCLVAVQGSVSITTASKPDTKRQGRNTTCNVLRWDKGDLGAYYNFTGQLLHNMFVPYNLLQCKCEGDACTHKADINRFYNDLILTLNSAAMHTIPMVHCNSSKPYWTAELQELKEDSIQACKAWCASGKPRQGWLYKIRLHAKYKYKAAIRNAAMNFEWDLDDELSYCYLQKDMNKFWKKWKQHFSKKSTAPLHINGHTQAESIAEKFKQSFSDSCFDSYCDKSSFDELCMHLHSETEMLDASTNNVFSVSDIEKALSSLKGGKAAGVDNIVKEHLTHSHPALIVHLKLLFNIMSVH